MGNLTMVIVSIIVGVAYLLIAIANEKVKNNFIQILAIILTICLSLVYLLQVAVQISSNNDIIRNIIIIINIVGLLSCICFFYICIKAKRVS